MLYICSKNGVEKKRVLYIIELRYIFLLQNSDLIITALISTIADNINANIIYTSLTISIKNKHKKSNTIANL